MAAIDEKKTDADGIAVFEIWDIAEYSINSRWVGDRIYRQCCLYRFCPARSLWLKEIAEKVLSPRRTGPGGLQLLAHFLSLP